MINVTRCYLPPLEEFLRMLTPLWESRVVTNEGPYSIELEQKLRSYVDGHKLLLTSSGMSALHLALRALNVSGEVITTPFSYVATANSIKWEHCTPVFADISPETFNIDPRSIETTMTKRTSAILAVHSYGIPCALEELASIALRNRLKLIYDGAHAFGVRVNGRSLLSYGDISVTSFHATKIFHTIQGGALITADEELADKSFDLRVFGHRFDDFRLPGTNARNSELHAAIGLLLLPRFQWIVEQRRAISLHYEKFLAGLDVRLVKPSEEVEYNYSYFPVLFRSETDLLKVKSALEKLDIYPRRYFYPALCTLKFLAPKQCPVAEDVARRVLCLPIYPELSLQDVERISSIVRESLQ